MIYFWALYYNASFRAGHSKKQLKSLMPKAGHHQCNAKTAKEDLSSLPVVKKVFVFSRIMTSGISEVLRLLKDGMDWEQYHDRHYFESRQQW